MIEILRSNNPVLMSFVTSVLHDAGIRHSVADGHMSVIDGSIGAVSNRVLVEDEQLDEAKRLLTEAGIPLDDAS
jgi:Putative prokaryotic signal transducing protein